MMSEDLHPVAIIEPVGAHGMLLHLLTAGFGTKLK
jgi:hypothetical protein